MILSAAAEPDLTAAKIRVLEQQPQVDELAPGVRLFMNRDYALKACPEWLKGKNFLRGRMERLNFTGVREGSIFVLTPDPECSGKDSRAAELEAAGFVRTQDPVFQLFGGNPNDRVRVYQKKLAVGEQLVLGKWAVLVGFDEFVPEPDPVESWPGNTGEILYNGIRLPESWPPRSVFFDDVSPMPVPYLAHPPKVIPIDVGRQLFVDDFLIEKTDLAREYHHATKYEGNPVLRPETPMETGKGAGMAVATPKSGGVWWNADKQVFQMWYEAEWLTTMAYATSKDGLKWDRPDLDLEPGTNRILPRELNPDSTTVFIDQETKDPSQRYKMFVRKPGGEGIGAYLMVSADGTHWTEPVMSGVMGGGCKVSSVIGFFAT
ncbi:MAG: hypothetical protein D4R65_14995 [Verrucomicrobiaceae bacterium]|nr:MAG: hypothetical protein D4R65_14995 [Verrucomicrobiaceae bacterium]